MISIIMIVYNVEQYLRQSIESVLNQDYRDIELIIVLSPNDKDNCEAICKEYAKADSRIKLIITPPKGAPDARNKGLEAVTGDYLGFVDPDDYVDLDMFSSMLKNLEETGADIAVCGRYYEYVNKTLADPKGSPRVYNTDEAIAVTLSNEGFFLHCWDKLYSKKIFEDLYFRTDVYVEDRIVVDKLLSKAKKVVYDSTPKYHFRERFNSNSRIKGMVQHNIEANEIMKDFLLENHPGISNELYRFMLYEYITAIQNVLTEDSLTKADIKEYQKKVKEYLRVENPFVSRNLRIKANMALYCPVILKMYTVRMKRKNGEEFERFS